MGDVILLDQHHPALTVRKNRKRGRGIQNFGDDITAAYVGRAWAKALRECLGDRVAAMMTIHDRTRYDTRLRNALIRFAVGQISLKDFDAPK